MLFCRGFSFSRKRDLKDESAAKPAIPPPPEMPPAGKAPWINVPFLTYGNDMKSLLESPNSCDFILKRQDHNHYVNKIMLACNSHLFRQVSSYTNFKNFIL